MRLFVALELPAGVKAVLADLQEQLRPAGAEIGWTRPDNIHLTLKFLGEVDPAGLPALAAALDGAAAGAEPFELSLAAPGCFPNPRQPRVFWVGLGGEAPAAVRLQRAVDDACAALGHPREDRAFRPHLTLGRFRGPRNAGALLERAGRIAMPSTPFAATELALFESELLPSGARYTTRHRAPLGERGW